jgi:hypothetical protein
MLPAEPDMSLHKFTPAELAGWKTYPVRVGGPRLSKCHQAPTLLVESMEGGFVTANCSKCGGKDVLRLEEFQGLGLWVGCPLCRASMNSQLLSKISGSAVGAGNYGYTCFGCRICIYLSDLLPRWEDVVGPRF